MLLSTNKLKALLTTGTDQSDFKSCAMALAQDGADITVCSTIAHPLLHVLFRTNKQGVNNSDIMKLIALNPQILANKDKFDRTALQSLLDALYYNEIDFDDFKQSAMMLARLHADITVCSTSDSHPTLLHVLVRNNKDGINNNEIAELASINSDILESKDKHDRTALQALIDAHHYGSCTFDTFKQSAMVLARQGADLALQGMFGARYTLLHVLVVEHMNDNKTEIEELIALRPDVVNVKDGNGYTPFYLLSDNNTSLASKKELAIRAEFFQKITAMSDYGVLLSKQDIEKGSLVIELADNLATMASQFFAQKPQQRNFAEFELTFSALLHSKDQDMRAYRMSWGTITANIAIALTGIGLLLIAGQLIYSQLTQGRPLFFFQKNKTTREEKIADIEQFNLRAV